MTTSTLGPVGVIGLGIMGSAIAEHLQQAGHRVIGVEIDAAARDRLAGRLSACVDSAAQLPAGVARLVSSLPSAAALDSVCDALIAAAPSPAGRGRAVLAETSTLPIADKCRARERLAAADIAMLDAPLSGTGAQARQRDLAVYASGDDADIAAMRPVFDAFARTCHAVGTFGNGMRMKLVANLLVAIHNVSTAEALCFAEALGLPAEQTLTVIGDGAGASRMWQVRGPAMATRQWAEPTMKVEVWRKDMAIIAQALAELSVPAPLFSACLPIYHAALSQGHGLHDTASVYAVLERLAGGPR